MIDTIYVEAAVADHPRARAILERFPRARRIACANYAQVFNARQQNFRAQKSRPALILARKSAPSLLPVPAGHDLGASNNVYFSHLLNCPFDCRYCFLQGMFMSAHYVLFVNYEDFADAISKYVTAADGTTHVFSGYDCDSLALEPMTGFADFFVDRFSAATAAVLELRTKSTQIRSLLRRPAHPGCIVAMSLAPEVITNTLEHGTPALSERLAAIRRLQAHGWPVGLRFDPLIPIVDGGRIYAEFFKTVLNAVDVTAIHSVTLGGMRMPRAFAKRMFRLYPEEPLFAAPYDDRGDLVIAHGSDPVVAAAHEMLAGVLQAERIFVQHGA